MRAGKDIMRMIDSVFFFLLRFPVVQKVKNGIGLINLYVADSAVNFLTLIQWIALSSFVKLWGLVNGAACGHLECAWY